MELKDKKTKIIFHNGILTIGGTIIEVVYEDSRIFFDFGSEYNPSSEIQPSDLQGLLDNELVPYLNNMFDPEIPLEGYQSVPDDYENTAVFISHVHLDHTKIINYLNPEIPLYTLEGTKSLLNTLNINNDFLFPLYEKKDGKNTRNIIGVAENDVVNIGEIKVKVMPVDHDAYGSCGLLIETPDLVISYTGDIRIHGYRKEQTLQFCEASRNCDVLLIEGVTVSFQEVDADVEYDKLMTEPKLIDKINELLIANPNRQMTFNYYISNIERILKIIDSCPRTVVLDAYYAYVVKEATGKEVHYYQLDDTDYGLNQDFLLDFDTLLQDETRFFWQLDKLALKYIDSLKKGGLYVHSNATPLGPFDPSYEPFMQAFADLDIEVQVISCSGHAYPCDLMKIINLIKPKLLVPIHSLHPERLHNESGERLLPEKKQIL